MPFSPVGPHFSGVPGIVLSCLLLFSSSPMPSVVCTLFAFSLSAPTFVEYYPASRNRIAEGWLKNWTNGRWLRIIWYDNLRGETMRRRNAHEILFTNAYLNLNPVPVLCQTKCQSMRPQKAMRYNTMCTFTTHPNTQRNTHQQTLTTIHPQASAPQTQHNTNRSGKCARA